MAYGKKAPVRQSNTDVVAEKLPTVGSVASNQERLVDRGVKRVSMGASSSPGNRYMDDTRDTGNQLQFWPPSKGPSDELGASDELKNPMSSYRQELLSEVENPSGGKAVPGVINYIADPARNTRVKAKMRKF